MSSLETYLHTHFNSRFPVKFGCILLPDCSCLFTNILAFPVPNVPQYQSLVDTMDAAVFHNVECRQLYDWEGELLRDIPQNFRKTVSRQNKRYTLTVPLVQDLYNNFFTKCCSAFHHNLLTHLYGLLPHHGSCAPSTHTHTHMAQTSLPTLGLGAMCFQVRHSQTKSQSTMPHKSHPTSFTPSLPMWPKMQHTLSQQSLPWDGLYNF